MAEHMLRKLAAQKAVMEEREPLKALWVAKDIATARVAAEIINEVAGADFARLVTSDDDSAVRRLRSAVKARTSLCIVAVRMVSEGFDCAHVSTIAYASNWTAELYVVQMVARAMRMTRTEHDMGQVLPAHILIPDVPDLRKVFAKVVGADLHMIEAEEQEKESGGGAGVGFLPRFDLTSVTAPQLDDVVVTDMDRSVHRADIDLMESVLQSASVGDGFASTYAPRMCVVTERFKEANVLPPRARSEVETRQANPRDVNVALRQQIKVRAHWWAAKGDTAVQEFQMWANGAAGIGAGGRDHAADEQLQKMLKLMNHRIDAHCERTGIRKPSFLAGDL
jgi:superfamily II DNA or RNA helicase